jgi:hypothetical protein
MIEEQVSLGLVEKNGTTYVIHDWKYWQGDGMSDAQRKRNQRARDKKRGMSRDNHVILSGDVTNTRAHARSASSSSSSSCLEGVQGEPPPAVTEPGPEFTALGHLAIEMSSVLALGSWVSNMGRLGHSAAAVRFALEQGAAAGKWDQRWLQGILKRVAIEGLPAISANGVHSPPTKAEIEDETEKWIRIAAEKEKARQNAKT